MSGDHGFVIVLHIGVRFPIVYGYGASIRSAWAKAAEWTEDLSGLECLPCSAPLAVALTNDTTNVCEVFEGVAYLAGEVA